MSMNSILRYEAFGIISGVYSSMKNIVLIARLLIRGDRAVASWWMMMSTSIPDLEGVRTNKTGLSTLMNLEGLIGKNPLTDLTGHTSTRRLKTIDIPLE